MYMDLVQEGLICRIRPNGRWYQNWRWPNETADQVGIETNWVDKNEADTTPVSKISQLFNIPIDFNDFTYSEKIKCINTSTDVPIAIKITLLESKLRKAIYKIVLVT